MAFDEVGGRGDRRPGRVGPHRRRVVGRRRADDRSGLVGERVRVQLEPEATRSWTADVLADRIVRLHRLALMRARAEQRARLNERGFPIETTAGFPSQADVDEYRRTIDF